MNDHSTTFEAVTSSMLKILKEDFSRTDSTLEGYAWKWNQLRQFMENNDLHSLTPKVCDDFLSSLYGSKDLTSLKSGDKKFLSAILLLKNYLITGQVIPRKVPVEVAVLIPYLFYAGLNVWHYPPTIYFQTLNLLYQKPSNQALWLIE